MGVSLFGRHYSTLGDSSTDTIIKTKGQVKILWGNKFIDLIKDGKLNVNADFIFSVKTLDKIGSKEGIYIVEEDGSVYIKMGNNLINLVGELGTTYVSFMGEQLTTAELKHLALTNIGFLYPSLEAVGDLALKNGIIYIESEKKLYIASEGELTEFKFEMPNPYTQQFIIAKTDSNDGALLIKGTGLANALMFENFFIYDRGDASILESPNSIIVRVLGKDIATFAPNLVLVNALLSSDMMTSKGATSTSGFRLYMTDSGSVLEVDNLIVRNTDSNLEYIYPVYWYSKNNIITAIEEYLDAEGTGYIVSLLQTNEYQVDDLIYSYGVYSDDGPAELVLIPLKVRLLYNEDGANDLYVELMSDMLDADTLAKLSSSSMLESLVGKKTFLIGTLEDIWMLRQKDENLDLINTNDFEEEQDVKSIKGRFGNLDELEVKVQVELGEVSEEVELDLSEKHGLYVENLYSYKGELYKTDLIAPTFKGGPNQNLFPVYEEGFDIPDDDDSQIVVTSKWVRKLINKIIPAGTITMWSGAAVPEGWALCDGSNGTPNLIDKFIRDGSTAGATGGKDKITLTETNLPAHKHNLSGIGSVTTSSENIITSELKSVATGGFDLPMTAGAGYSNSTETVSHSHTVDLSSKSTDNTGQGTEIEILPSYYTLMYIMKLPPE